MAEGSAKLQFSNPTHAKQGQRLPGALPLGPAAGASSGEQPLACLKGCLARGPTSSIAAGGARE
jgi:hypothetical protein